MIKKLSILASLILTVAIAFALNPVKDYTITPAESGMKYEEVTFKTADGVQLYGWYFKAPKQSGKAIILSHNGDGNMADLLEIASNFVSSGYNVLTYDYRGYGKSDPFEINPKFVIYAQFEKDLTAAIKYIDEKKSGITTIDLYGQGIGAGLSITVGVASKKVKKIIADSPYGNLNDLQAAYEKVKGEKVNIPIGFEKNKLEPQFALELPDAQLKQFMFISGSLETIYTEKAIKEFTKPVKKNAVYYNVKDATNISTYTSDKNKYIEEVKKFIEQ